MLETHTIFDKDESASKTQTHHVTQVKEAVRDQNRVNIYVDDKFYCSLDISQVVDFSIKIGRKLSDAELAELKRASDFGKFYARALEYVLMRPHSIKEIRVKNRKTGEYQTKVQEGCDPSLVPLVLKRLEERGYLDDYRFAELWVENRSIKKGISPKKLRNELARKGIGQSIIEEVLQKSSRDERDELRKVITRKANRYADRQKLIQYLVRQGFNYSDVLEELASSSDGA